MLESFGGCGGSWVGNWSGWSWSLDYAFVERVLFGEKLGLGLLQAF